MIWLLWHPIEMCLPAASNRCPAYTEWPGSESRKSCISQKHMHSKWEPTLRYQSQWVCNGGTQGTGNVNWWGRMGLEELDGIWGRAAVILEPFKSLQGTAHLSVFSVFTRVPHDTALAILSEGWDLCRTVDPSFSYLALRLVIFGMELWLQVAGSVLLWLHTINTPCGHRGIRSINTQLDQAHPLSSSPHLTLPPVPFMMEKPEGLSN